MLRGLWLAWLVLAACQRPAFTDAGSAAAQKRAFKPRPLTACTISEISGTRPIFRKQLHEGDIAWYGLVLLTERDPAVVAYLVEQETGALWQYQRGYGATAEDTALVLEGLMTAGGPPTLIRRSLDRLVSAYYRPQGYFETVYGGRAPYWSGPDAETNAHVGYLLLKGAPTAYAPQITAAARYLVRAQQDDGGWTGKWFPSRTVPTFYAVRLLRALGPGYAAPVSRATGFLRHSQERDGSWDASVIETAAAVLALRSAGYEGVALTLGERWLRAWQTGDEKYPQAVLQYWMEDKGKRLFYVCFDEGTISSAWARLALPSVIP